MVRVIGLVIIAMAVGGRFGVLAQATWTGIGMPYEAASHQNTAPTFSFATDPVAEIADIPPLRGVGLPDGATELRVWLGFGIAIPHLFLRLTSQGGVVRGELVRWWGSMDHPSDDPRFADFLAEERTLAGSFGCNEEQSGSEWVEMRDGIAVPHRAWTFACKADFRDEGPDWSNLLDRLTALGVAVLPDPRTLTPEATPVLDGISVEVEVLSGAAYRTYMYGNPDYQPWPEADSAQAIIDVILQVDSQHARSVMPE